VLDVIVELGQVLPTQLPDHPDNRNREQNTDKTKEPGGSFVYAQPLGLDDQRVRSPKAKDGQDHCR
jgi:hypothetical protein